MGQQCYWEMGRFPSLLRNDGVAASVPLADRWDQSFLTHTYIPFSRFASGPCAARASAFSDQSHPEECSLTDYLNLVGPRYNIAPMQSVPVVRTNGTSLSNDSRNAWCSDKQPGEETLMPVPFVVRSAQGMTTPQAALDTPESPDSLTVWSDGDS